ncbi:ABC transporter ATP-binding protein [Desulfuribacillus alkaliarsenatis]|uniref:Multidrug ABC transporter ATP-binding protein n=1 Tax=Desulfuribacillus alkaliarsenatis TaxID=766136 RepID=A0A1E5G4X2_9FIRM|nr:ABC transporter ATP-binding protein [Desulfuribacillus alkaliarsenatis]OEF98227.1 multidrug ABC transporter ATP-binding protein [Desulfuribacillus alkaliarsenatis]
MLKEFKTMTWFFKKHYHRYLLGIFAVLIVDGLQLLLPKILGWFADDLQAGIITRDALHEYAFMIIAIGIGIFIFRFFWRFFINGAARYLEFELRNMLVEHFMKLSPSFYNYRKTGDLMAHATNDIKSIRMAMGPAIVMSIDAIILGSATVVMMVITVGWKLTLIALLPMPFLALVVTRFGKVIHNRFKRVQEAFATLTDVTQENVAGIRVVKTFAQEKREMERFQVANKNKFERNMHLTRIWGLFDPLVELIAALSFLLVLSYGSIMVLNNQISLGDFVAFYGYLALLTWPMMAFGWVYNMLQRGSASLARINALLNEVPEVQDLNAQQTSLKGKDIEFRNLSFAYKEDSEPVLKNISLTIPTGSTVAFLGKTGSGKSSIVNVLIRQYNPPKSTLFIGSTDILNIPLALLNTDIGYVPQDSFLFSTSIRENIAFGNYQASDNELERAAYIADIHENILELPDGYDTIVGERGVTLSGGQKQRISMARAIVRNPEVFIMDDSLSAVDTQTEERILSRLKEFMQERTTIIIAHRISTVQHADLIVYLEDGQIIEQGTHEQLLSINGKYYQTYMQQQLEQQLDGLFQKDVNKDEI